MIKSLFKKSGVTLMELLVVVGIFTLIVGVSLTLVSTGRLSVFSGEAQIQAEEHARQLINRISKELRLSSASHVHIYDDFADSDPAGVAANSGSIIYIQIPVGSYATTLAPHLDAADYSIEWGDGTTAGRYIYYCVRPDEGFLFRGTIDNKGEADVPEPTGYGWSVPVIGSNSASLTFDRESATSNLIEIEVQGRGKSATQEATRSLKSTIKLRN